MPDGLCTLARRSARGAGFTLVELLVVLAILAILAALLLPVCSAVRARAQQISCLSQVRQIGQAHRLYVADHDEQLPDWFVPGPPRPSPFGARRFWPELLAPYIGSGALFLDPAAIWEAQDDLRLADYALMTSGPEGSGAEADPYRRWPGPPLALTSVVRPAETISLLDGWTTTGWRLGPLPRHGGANAA